MIDSIVQSLYGLLQAVGYTHPIHPAFTHIPIGLVFGSFVFGLLSFILRHSAIGRAARYCAVVAIVSVLFTAFLGLLDWQHFFGGGWLPPIKVKIALAGLLIIALLLALVLGRRTERTSKLLLVLYVLSLFISLGLGYFGGQLVYEGRTPMGPARFREGETLFTGNCSGCHPYGGNIVNPGQPIRGAPQLKDYALFLNWIRNPQLPSGAHGLMPPFPSSRIADGQVKDLYEYILNVIEGRTEEAKGEPAVPRITVKTDPVSVDKGRVLFEANCAYCHTANSTETLVGPGLKGILRRERLSASGRPATPENIYRQLNHPYKNMPSFAGKLSDEEVLDLIAFLNTR
jgi:mono/diheme cytochrome c family protein/uncharacterized membrane protein